MFARVDGVKKRRRTDAKRKKLPSPREAREKVKDWRGLFESAKTEGSEDGRRLCEGRESLRGNRRGNTDNDYFLIF